MSFTTLIKATSVTLGPSQHHTVNLPDTATIPIRVKTTKQEYRTFTVQVDYNDLCLSLCPPHRTSVLALAPPGSDTDTSIVADMIYRNLDFNAVHDEAYTRKVIISFETISTPPDYVYRIVNTNIPTFYDCARPHNTDDYNTTHVVRAMTLNQMTSQYRETEYTHTDTNLALEIYNQDEHVQGPAIHIAPEHASISDLFIQNLNLFFTSSIYIFKHYDIQAVSLIAMRDQFPAVPAPPVNQDPLAVPNPTSTYVTTDIAEHHPLRITTDTTPITEDTTGMLITRHPSPQEQATDEVNRTTRFLPVVTRLEHIIIMLLDLLDDNDIINIRNKHVKIGLLNHLNDAHNSHDINTIRNAAGFSQEYRNQQRHIKPKEFIRYLNSLHSQESRTAISNNEVHTCPLRQICPFAYLPSHDRNAKFLETCVAKSIELSMIHLRHNYRDNLLVSMLVLANAQSSRSLLAIVLSRT